MTLPTTLPIKLIVTISSLSVLTACAALPAGTKRDPRDRYERFNRTVYKVNTALDHAILRPVARGYVKVTPQPVRTSVSNVLGNLEYTKTIANDLLQGYVIEFGTDVVRLVVNSTIGVAGIFDTATHFGLEKHDRDFGQTLGKWGVPTGPYLMLPILGPSDIRDTAGLVPDHFLTLDNWINNQSVQIGLSLTRGVDHRAKLLPLDDTLDSAFDPYTLIRSVWFQRRDYEVRGDSPAEEPSLDEEDE